MPFDVPEYDNIDDTEYEPTELERATHAMRYFGERGASAAPSEGQRVVYQLDPGGTLNPEFQTLMRGQNPEVAMWQVTISPTFIASQGADNVSDPLLRNARPLVRMTWGGGGVTWRNTFIGPARGASFCVAGSEVMVEIAPRDLLTVYTPATVPAVIGWIKPIDSAQDTPLFESSLQASPAGPNSIPAWARYLWVGGNTPGATFTVAWIHDFGTFTLALPAGYHRVPVPELAGQVTVTASSGSVFQQWETRFAA